MTKVLCDVNNQLFNEVDTIFDSIITEDYKELSYKETDENEVAVFSNGINKFLVETSIILNKYYSLRITDITEA